MINTILIAFPGSGKSWLAKYNTKLIKDLDYGFIRESSPKSSLNDYNKVIEDFISGKLAYKLLLLNDPYAITQGNYFQMKKIRVIMVLPHQSIFKLYTKRVKKRAQLNDIHKLAFANLLTQHPNWVTDWSLVAKHNNIPIKYITELNPTLSRLIVNNIITNDLGLQTTDLK